MSFMVCFVFFWAYDCPTIVSCFCCLSKLMNLWNRIEAKHGLRRRRRGGGAAEPPLGECQPSLPEFTLIYAKNIFMQILSPHGKFLSSPPHTHLEFTPSYFCELKIFQFTSYGRRLLIAWNFPMSRASWKWSVLKLTLDNRRRTQTQASVPKLHWVPVWFYDLSSHQWKRNILVEARSRPKRQILWVFLG